MNEDWTFYCFEHRTHIVQAPEGSKLECPRCGDALYHVPKGGTEVPQYKVPASKAKRGGFVPRKRD